MHRAVKRFAALFLALCLAPLFPLRAAALPAVIYRHASGDGTRRVALTFDDGPHPRYTPQILDILAEYGVKATFFVVGRNVGYHPEIVRRAMAEGHEIGNHTHHHYRTAKIERAEVLEDILECQEELSLELGIVCRFFRPPEGVFDEELRHFCEEQGLTIVMWSVDTRDWAHTKPQEIVKNVRENVRDGSIILMHDFIGKKSPTPTALRQLIPMLQKSGYEFVTVSELLRG